MYAEDLNYHDILFFIAVEVSEKKKKNVFVLKNKCIFR